ncbi:MAG: DegT/DnrJ/EryC1/StrS family aminotransferase [Candidatus Omnitrophota bacterium]|nr:MAG: DegT/DnrJ/EryC1/StrS family aminotransferase [Candidatus Omnitrophota bacterium]
MVIKVWDYLKEYRGERKEIFSAVKKVLESGWLILGENVRKFEEEFACYCGVKFGVGVNSGTDALFLGLKALGIDRNDEVITVSNTAVPTIAAIVSCQAKPRFVDIDPGTYLMDTSKIEKAITKRTKCILAVHLYGQCVNMQEVNKIAKKHGLKVLEDCAQSHGATFKDRKAGSMSDVSAFSFYPTKVLGGFGDGGMVMTNNKYIYEKLRRLRFYGMEKIYYSFEHGYNSRLDEMHAAILLNKLKHLEKYIKARIALAHRYNDYLADSGLILPEVACGNRHVYYLYVCRHKRRDYIISELKKRNIFVNVSYPWPIHIMRAYRYLGYRKGSLPHSEKAATEIFSLPMYPSLSNQEQMRVSQALKAILKKI